MRSCAFIVILVLTSLLQSASAQSVGGSTTGATTFCSTTNSGVVSLSGYTGSILFWQSSTDGGITWNNIANTTPNQTYFNLPQTTCYRVIVQSGSFPADTSTISCITVFPASVGGTLSGGGTFCADSGPGTITLSGYTGSILYWQSSTNGGVTWTTIANTTPTQSYSSITQSTLYWAVVQSGSGCPSDTSTQASFTVHPLTVGGAISGATSVCSSGNSGFLSLTGYTGSVTGWYSSTDGTTWTPTGSTTPVQSYTNLSQTTSYYVIVQSGTCPPDTSTIDSIIVSTPSNAGTISGGGVFCGVPATGVLNVTGQNGAITGWESSTDGGATWTPTGNTTISEVYVGLTQTTSYYVIVQNGACAPDTSNIESVQVFAPTVAGTVSASDTVCFALNGDTLNLSGQTGNILGWLFSTDGGTTWSPLSNTNGSQVFGGLTQETWFTAVVQNGPCAVDTSSIAIISIYPVSAVSAGADTSIMAGSSVQLNGSGAGTVFWTPAATLDNPLSFTPVATPVTGTTYIMIVTDLNGCINTDTVTVNVILPEFAGMITNLMTPNSDGINDYFYIEGIENFADNNLMIYNIYGNQVYSKEGYTNDWDGDDLPDGTYYYVLTFDSNEIVKKGSIDILRK